MKLDGFDALDFGVVFLGLLNSLPIFCYIEQCKCMVILKDLLFKIGAQEVWGWLRYDFMIFEVFTKATLDLKKHRLLN